MPANDLLNAIARKQVDNRPEDGPAITQVFRFRRAKQPAVEHGLTLEAPDITPPYRLTNPPINQQPSNGSG